MNQHVMRALMRCVHPTASVRVHVVEGLPTVTRNEALHRPSNFRAAAFVHVSLRSTDGVKTSSIFGLRNAEISRVPIDRDKSWCFQVAFEMADVACRQCGICSWPLQECLIVELRDDRSGNSS
jgi:hypothetical protein